MPSSRSFQPAFGKLSGGQSGQSQRKIFIANAGLVLLTPFLPHFFRVAGLTRQDKFTSADGVAWAACLLQRVLAPGESRLLESEMALNKLLCGWPLSEPLPEGSLTADSEEREKA